MPQKPYDAIDIEYAFSKLFGHSQPVANKCHHADVFRNGKAEDLRDFLTNVANVLDVRISMLPFGQDDSQLFGGLKSRIEAANDRTRKIATTIEADEPEDYHWLLYANLAWVLGALLDYIEREQEDPMSPPAAP